MPYYTTNQVCGEMDISDCVKTPSKTMFDMALMNVDMASTAYHIASLISHSLYGYINDEEKTPSFEGIVQAMEYQGKQLESLCGLLDQIQTRLGGVSI